MNGQLISSRGTWLMVGLYLLVRLSWAQVNNAIPVPNQQVLTIRSTILSEIRPIWIYLPNDYQTSQQAYPVLYLLDGENHFGYVSQMIDFLSNQETGRIPKLIVVAITNTNRTRDFTPVRSVTIGGKTDSTRQTGGGDQFLRFISQELIPTIEKTFRTQPYRILEGHSLGGLFALYAQQSQPTLFQSMIVISPAIFPEYNQVLTKYTSFLHANRSLSSHLYLSIGNEDTRKTDSIAHQLKTSASLFFHWKYKVYRSDDHFSVPYPSMYDGLRFIYSAWYADPAKLTTYPAIKNHYESLSRTYGYRIEPSEELINRLGYHQLRFGTLEKAISLFRQNVKNHPTSYNVYDSLGEAYMRQGATELAIQNYEQSLMLNPNNEEGRLILTRLRQGKP